MSQCARTGDKRKGKQRGRAGAGQRVKGERGQKTEERHSGAQERSAPCTANSRDAHPGYDVPPDSASVSHIHSMLWGEWA